MLLREIPLPVGTYDQMYMKAFNAIVMSLIEAYDSDVIVFELGADALVGDPLGHLCLNNNTYADIAQFATGLAELRERIKLSHNVGLILAFRPHVLGSQG